ncbi:hypothetical protein F5X99DRAFT_369415 [Biscogniauxia marginata]|nr:hypothetical protein F5X99DRAFT_369415 [Biscogniauxia marginata]
MFNSWIFKADGALSERKRTFDPGTGKTVCPQACSHCRAKKLKCTGERSGCQRCKALSRACVYIQSARGQHGANNRRADQSERKPTTPEKQQHRKRSTNSKHVEDGSPRGSGLVDDLLINPVSTERSHARSNPPTSPQSTLPKPSTDSPSISPPPSSSSLPVSRASLVSGDFSPNGEATPLPFDLESFFVDPGGPDENYVTADMMMLADNSGNIDLSDQVNSAGCSESSSLSSLDIYSVLGGLSNHTNEHYLSQGPCMGDLGPFYPSLTAETDFEMVLDSTPTSSFLSSPESMSSCECLQRILLLMDEVEDMLGEESSSIIEEMPDLVLATHKEALRHMREMLQCAKCAGSVENMTVLTFLAAKLARLCRRVPRALNMNRNPDSVMRNTFAEDEGSVCIRSYKVDSLDEYQAVVRGLLELQLHELNDLVKQLVNVSLSLESDAMARRLAAAKRTLAAIPLTSGSSFK